LTRPTNHAATAVKNCGEVPMTTSTSLTKGAAIDAESMKLV
jgi:hypothetical protein